MIDLGEQRAHYLTSVKILEELGSQMPFLLKATMTDARFPLQDRLTSLELIGTRLSQLYGDTATWIPHTVRSYVVLSLEFLKLQRELENTGRYLLATEREAQERVYQSKNVFGDYYLPGLLLSEALWPTHHGLNQLFRNHFLPCLNREMQVLEVGVGTGFHLYHLFQQFPDINYEGIDISDYAIQFSQKFAFGGVEKNPKAKFYRQDITQGHRIHDNHYDAILLGEILEHVENPLALLQEMRRVAKPNSPMFMTTVIFAANIDHIYLFEKAEDIRQLIAKSGWDIAEEKIFPVYPQDTPDRIKRPMNYGVILRNQK